MKHPVALSLLLAAALSAPVRAEEIRLPEASPGARVVQTIGITDVEITYHRPGVKGRTIWGGLEPWGKVWRMGANEATTISFTHPVKVEGRDVPAGTYALFAIPAQDKWTLILNKTAKQWGAYAYKESEDVLRFDVAPQAGPATEWMVFTITPASPGSAVVEMAWDKVRVPFKIQVDVDKIVWSELDAAIQSKPEPRTYLMAAYYAKESGQRMDEALAWIDKAQALKESFGGHDLRARLLHRMGRKDEALKQLDKAIAFGQGDKNLEEVIQDLEKLKAEWKAAA